MTVTNGISIPTTSMSSWLQQYSRQMALTVVIYHRHSGFLVSTASCALAILKKTWQHWWATLGFPSPVPFHILMLLPGRSLVYLPHYNRPLLLTQRAIPSIWAQTDPDWEMLVVGDGTDDETVARMEVICVEDPRINFCNLARDIYPEGHDAWGLYGLTALNLGLDFARGEWISVLNDDDEKTPDNHALLLEEAERSGADFVWGMSDTFKGDPPKSIGQFYGGAPMGDGTVTQGSYIYRASLDFRYRRDCYTRGRNGDADMWIRMRESGVKSHFVPRVVHHYYRNWP
jgi:glycosyltransferase involved in cell wall biosynthesis